MAVKILLVDDNAVVRRALRYSIESQTDWEVAGEAENGKVAIELVQRSSPDVIILDLSMPVMNGLDAARHIKALSPQTRILLFTLHASPQLTEDARRAGINDVLSLAPFVPCFRSHVPRARQPPKFRIRLLDFVSNPTLAASQQHR
jgi:DNA-binding NarL/FixJ family response regulator